MRHYEIVILVHPDQSEQVPEMIARYREIVESNGGAIHRSEDWGMRRLEYTIRKMHKAHYALFNIECSGEVLDELKQGFRYNDAVLRHMVIRRDEARAEMSPILKSKQKSDAEEAERQAVKSAAAESDRATAKSAQAAKASEPTQAATGEGDAKAAASETQAGDDAGERKGEAADADAAPSASDSESTTESTESNEEGK